MSISRKYGRTMHYDFSPGTTSDDRINKDWYSNILSIDEILDLEKLDGENQCLNGIGVFARSHAAPTRHPWSNHFKEKYSTIKNDLKENNIELFGENMYAMHSIIYPELDSHFYIFGVRCLDKWLSWEEVKWYADFFDYPIVPVIKDYKVKDYTENEIRTNVISQASKSSNFGSLQNGDTPLPCTMEGIVSRNKGEYEVDKMQQNVFKYVRKDHVKVTEHWSRNWKRAPLKWEGLK